MRRAAYRLALALAGTVAPTFALACPICARDQTPYAPLIIGALIAAPYLVTAVVVRAIRSWGEEP
jgi:hypothetical protein